jgi:hypothetical protein
MKQATLTRQASTPQGTPGELTTDQSTDVFATLELPWQNDQPDVSCIPPAPGETVTYLVKKAPSEHMTRLFNKHFPGVDMYEMQDVQGRSGCFIHPGNWAGDVSQGYRSDVEGCILLGLSHADLEGQAAVISSVTAIGEFLALMGGEDFQLTIKSAATSAAV